MAQITRSRLFTRVLLALVAIFAASAALSATLAAYHLARVLDDQYRSKGEAIARTIANSSVEDILLERDPATLQALVDLYAETEGVGYILVRAGDGEILAHTFVPAVPDILREVSSDRPVVQLAVEGENYMHVSAPILDGEIGQVHVGMKQSTIDAAYWATVQRQTILGVLIGLIAVLVAHLLVKRISHPLLCLAQHARSVASLDSLTAHKAVGDLSPIGNRSDEVGQLARALRHMIDALAEREQRLKLAELSVRLSESKFRSLIENVSDVVILLGRQGEAQYVSPSLKRLLDFSPREWIGREVLPLFHPDDREAFRIALGNCVPTPSAASTTEWHDTASAETRMIRADGTIRIVDVAMCNLLDDPAVEGIVVTIRDITDRKRTLELANARDAAEEASRLKSQFLTNISHEIRTPMHHIIGLTELALASTSEDEPRDYLETMRTSADDLMTILQGILDFSRIESGKLELEPAPFRLHDLVSDSLSLLAARAHEKRLELMWEVDPAVPDVLIGDANRLRQVLLNLVGNAIKFTSVGEVHILIRPKAEGRRPKEKEEAQRGGGDSFVLRPSSFGLSEESFVLCIVVRDTGIGIAPEQQQLIFQPFTQADGSMTRVHGGTGLGLAIARSLVGLMGGNLSVRSELGIGSEFEFDVILGVGSEELLPTWKSLPVEGLIGLRVLVVDDNATNGRIVSGLLQRWGMSPIVVNGAEPALLAFEECGGRGESFHLVLLDAQMPGMDGYALAERLRERKGAEIAPLLMLSSSDRVEGGTRCRELGLAGYLTKPLRPIELQAALLSALGRQG